MVVAVMSDENSEPVDKRIECRDCAETFVLTVVDQAFFKERGLAEPKRCRDCRKFRRREREQQEASS